MGRPFQFSSVTKNFKVLGDNSWDANNKLTKKIEDDCENVSNYPANGRVFANPKVSITYSGLSTSGKWMIEAIVIFELFLEED